MRSWLAILVLAVGCGPTSGLPDHPDAGGDAPVVMGDEGVERFVGHIAMLNPVQFGGAPYCNYKVTLSAVTVDATMDARDGLVTMNVADTMTEAIVGTCQYPPAPQNRQQFDHRGAPLMPVSGETFMPMLVGIPSNAPMAEVTTSVLRDKSGSFLTTTLRWKRTDIGAPFDWQVVAPSALTLDRVACQPGGSYCFGGTVEGAEYACAPDGRHFVELKRCTQGCPVTPVPPAPYAEAHCK